jgi:hypothetical protein
MVEPLRFRQKRHRRQRHQQSVAVGLRSRRKGISNHAASSRAVVDHDRLTEKLLERLRHRACCEIGLSARRKRDNHSEVAQGPGLRRGRRQKRCDHWRCKDGPDERALQKPAAMHFHSPWGDFRIRSSIDGDRM